MSHSDPARPRSPRRQRHTRWWRRAAASIFAVVVAAMVAGAAAVLVGHVQLQPVLSGSMRPGIQPGDLAVIRPVPVSQLHTGEIIAYFPPDHTTPVMHRIVSITAAGIVTKGDANSVSDPWGRVKPASPTVEHLVAVVPKLGWLGDVRRQLILVAGGVLVLVAAGAVGSSLRRRTDEEEPSREDHPVSTMR